MNNNKSLAIVFGRNYTSRLTMIRAIGLAGCDVVDVQLFHGKEVIRKELIDSCSKFVIKTYMIDENDFDEYIKIIDGYRDYDGRVVLLPTDDHSAAALDFNYENLKSRFILPNVHHKQGELVKLMDKEFQKTIASKVGIPIAKGWVCEFIDDHYNIPSDITYPCFTKPQQSYFNAMKIYMKKCNNLQDLENALNAMSKINHNNVLVEQYISIEKEYGVLGVAYEGKSIIPSIIHKEKDYLGVTAVGKISPISQVNGLQEKIQNFISATGINGLFDIDMYESEGTIYFNELNCRFGAGGFAVINSVANLVDIFYQLSINKTKNIDDYQVNTNIGRFASEKVCKQMLLNRIITLFEYKRIMKEVDFSFLKQDYDIEPYNVFMKTFYKEWFKSRIKWIVKRWLK